MNETYIKMADCPEIQGQKPQWLDGEFVALRGVDTEAEQAGEWLMHPDPRFVWCPMQHQLQEMVGFESSEQTEGPMWYLITMTKFIIDTRHSGPPLADFKELWLAYYMHEKHNKIWTGEAWIGGNE